jgi:hypothetical protein
MGSDEGGLEELLELSLSRGLEDGDPPVQFGDPAPSDSKTGMRAA